MHRGETSKMLTKYQSYLRDCAKYVEYASTEDASSKHLEEKVRTTRNILPC